MKTKTINYEAPFMEVAQVEVESGIAFSTREYGEAGYAGQESGYNDYEGDL